MKKIILASTSPRRKEIFSKLKLPFSIKPSDYKEDMSLNLPAEKLVVRLAAEKAKAVAKKYKNSVVIAADTFVVFNKKHLGKPKTAAKARAMLKLLSGKKHYIITGVAIVDSGSGKIASFYEKTFVKFAKLSQKTIDAYIKTGEPLDRAGAYAIQERGALLVEKIEGDFYNAVGLPLKTLVQELKKFGILPF